MENTNELEQMRHEVAVLKEKLEKQTIINEEHIRRSMKDKVRGIKRQVIILSVIGVAAIAYCYWILYVRIGLSLPLAIFTDLFLAAAVAYSVWSTWRLNPDDMMGEDLTSAGKEIARMKKLGILWKRVAYPFLVVWFAWIVVETVNAGLENEMVFGFLLGCGLGLAGGIVGGMLYDRKQTKIVDGILKQIEELGK